MSRSVTPRCCFSSDPPLAYKRKRPDGVVRLTRPSPETPFLCSCLAAKRCMPRVVMTDASWVLHEGGRRTARPWMAACLPHGRSFFRARSFPVDAAALGHAAVTDVDSQSGERPRIPSMAQRKETIGELNNTRMTSSLVIRKALIAPITSRGRRYEWRHYEIGETGGGTRLHTSQELGIL